MYRPDPELRSDHARKAKCSRCGAPVLRALAGRVAGIHVMVDPEPLDHIAAHYAPRQGLMLWCLYEGKLGTKRILWRDHGHCSHPPLVDHRCPTDRGRLTTLRDLIREKDQGR